jgi:hypothetical protein
MNSALYVRAACALAIIGALVQPVALASAPSAADRSQRVTMSLSAVAARDAIPALERATRFTIVPRWKDESHTEGLDPDRLIDLRCTAISPIGAIEKLASRLGADVTWQPTDSGEIEMGPRSRLNETVVVKVYAIKDLLSRTPEFRACPTIDLDAALHHESGSVLKADIETPKKDAEPLSEAERLVELITTLIGREQWDLRGGPAHARIFQDSLIIRAPGYIHRQIADALATPR